MNQERHRLQQRLNGYWRIEGLNIFLLPAITLYLVNQTFDAPITWGLLLSLLSTSWMLVVGTVALRMLKENLLGNPNFEAKWIPYLSAAQAPSALLALGSILWTLMEVIGNLGAWHAGHWAMMIFSLLGLLEYINYYHRQLQHFDNQADWQRLRQGKGFRPSHLARALIRYRKHRHKPPKLQNRSK